MLMFRDFVPKQVRNAGMFGGGRVRDLRERRRCRGRVAQGRAHPTHAARDRGVPNIWAEDGSTIWNQFIRVWYDDGRDVEGHPFR